MLNSIIRILLVVNRISKEIHLNLVRRPKTFALPKHFNLELDSTNLQAGIMIKIKGYLINQLQNPAI